MISSMALEWRGRWRGPAIAVLLALPLLPACSFIWFALFSGGRLSYGGVVYEQALGRSVLVASLVSLGAFVPGLPIGVLTALYDFRGRRLLLPVALLPLLVPTFLWPLGWRWLFEHRGNSLLPYIRGYTGCVLMFLPVAVTLVLFTTIASLAGLGGSQLAAARLAGGERTVFRLACKYAAAPGALAALLAGILTLSDPAAGFAVGLHLASSEILISFAAFYDYGLAGRQCLALALVVLAVAPAIAYFAAPRLAAESSGRQLRLARRCVHPVMSKLAGRSLGTLVFVLTILPSMGLIFPLRRWIDVVRACHDLASTSANTLAYAAGAGFFAAFLGLALALCAGREERLRRLAVGVCLIVFALPPILLALGFVRGAAHLPAWIDPVLRGKAGVCLALGLRFLPVAALLALRSWTTVPSSLTRAAGVHGLSLGRYLWRVVLPLQRRALVSAVLLVGLMASAEIGMTLLLYPPGQESLPLHIFQIIGYPAPSSRLAALCAINLALAVALLVPIWNLAGEDWA
jgi:iron(III) transport system permease protein